MEWIATIGAACTLALGALGLAAPGKAARLVGIVPEGKTGLSEIRATYGGLFIGLGAGCLWLQQPEVYLAVGLGWLFAAASRTASVFLDQSFSGKNVGGIVVEAGIGLSLASGML